MHTRRKSSKLTLAILILSLFAAGCRSATASPATSPVPSTVMAVTSTKIQPTLPSHTPPVEYLPQDRATPLASAALQALDTRLTGLDLRDFYEVSYRELMLRDPELVLEVGLEETYGVEEARLTDISDAYLRETLQMQALILERLRQYERASLPTEDQLSYDVYEWYLEDKIQGGKFLYYEYFVTFMLDSVQEEIIRFFTDIHPVADQADVEAYLTRLSLVDEKFDQLLEGLRLREQAGIIPPRFIIQWTRYGMRSIVQGAPRLVPFYTAFKEKLDELPDLSAEEKQGLLTGAEEAINTSVIPAYRALDEYLAQLESMAPTDDGLWQFPQGEAYYNYLLRHYTTTDLSADQIHGLGLQEVARIQAEMRTIFDELGYPQDLSLGQLFDQVTLDSGLISGGQVLQTYDELIREASENLSPAFDILPRAEVVVLGDAYGGFYVPASIDGSRPGAFYAGVDGGGEPYYGMPTLAYHEAIPGHHLQIAIAQELENNPSFRRGTSFTAFVEGWALYAELLASELGWYEGDPYGDLGRLQAEAFRAVRLVVDTGIHAQGWTFNQALDYMNENLGYDPRVMNLEQQVARYIAWPGQAVAYKIGMLKIVELRQHAMDQLGEDFDLKEFHNLLLISGGLPLEILERLVDDYINAKLSG
jgi:uncharacterized protein (DUF885 family)